MTSDKLQIRIDSILGGHSPTTHFAMEDQFRASLGIDPGQGIDDSFTSKFGKISSGLLRPTAITGIGGTNDAPMWIIPQPKTQNIYVYDSVGSVYSRPLTSSTTLSHLCDLNDGGDARGNGAAYYDNYVYFARCTTVARYGPLDGTPTFTDDYWVTTLGKTALTNTNYPSDYLLSHSYPNHILHRHSDGRLYIADVVGNTGTIHYIQTKKTTVEGDTDNGSTYDKLHVGYGLWPTAMESYGSDLAIAFIETVGGLSQLPSLRAKIAFWDTISTDVNQITWVEFPDQLITGMKNINGILYVASGSKQGNGFRITRFVGGYTFEEVFYTETGQPPFAGAMDGDSNRLLFGSWTSIPEQASCVYSLGLQKNLGFGLFNVASSRASTSATGIISALALARNQDFASNMPIIGWSAEGGGGTDYCGIDELGFRLDGSGVNYSNAPSNWWSQTYRIGQPFKIISIRIPLAQVLNANITVIPKIYIDSGANSKTLTAITSENYGTNRQTIVIRPDNLTADNDFWLELRWTGSALCVIALPITIEYELLDIDSAHP